MDAVNALLIRLPRAVSGSENLSIYAVELTEQAKAVLQNSFAIDEFSIAVQEDDLLKAWTAIVNELDAETNTVSQDVLDTGTGLARLCRNVLIGNSRNKWAVRSCETLIRRGIFLSTSFGSINEERFYPFQRAALQIVANLLAPVKQDQRERQLAADLVAAYIQEEERSNQIVLRSLDSKDPQVTMSVLTIVLNALRTDPGLIEIVTNGHGTKILAKVLDKIDSWSSSPSDTLEERCFNLSYELFANIVNSGKQAKVYSQLGSRDAAMTPSQIVFLRLLDGYMHGSNCHYDNSESKLERTSVTFLVPVLLSAATYAESTLRALAQGGPQVDEADHEDPDLNRTLEGSVLLNQCLIASALEETPLGHERELIARGISGADQADEPTLSTLRSYEDEKIGVVEGLIALLGALEALFPGQKRPQGNPPEGENQGRTTLQGFITLKRDIVQLLGLIVYNDRASQDRVRVAEGIHLILSLCIVDEENPFIREHALLTIRNLMVNNPENQAVVGTMDPIGIVGPNGELMAMPKKA